MGDKKCSSVSRKGERSNIETEGWVKFVRSNAAVAVGCSAFEPSVVRAHDDRAVGRVRSSTTRARAASNAARRRRRRRRRRRAVARAEEREEEEEEPRAAPRRADLDSSLFLPSKPREEEARPRARWGCDAARRRYSSSRTSGRSTWTRTTSSLWSTSRSGASASRCASDGERRDPANEFVRSQNPIRPSAIDPGPAPVLLPFSSSVAALRRARAPPRNTPRRSSATPCKGCTSSRGARGTRRSWERWAR